MRQNHYVRVNNTNGLASIQSLSEICSFYFAESVTLTMIQKHSQVKIQWKDVIHSKRYHDWSIYNSQIQSKPRFEAILSFSYEEEISLK